MQSQNLNRPETKTFRQQKRQHSVLHHETCWVCLRSALLTKEVLGAGLSQDCTLSVTDPSQRAISEPFVRQVQVPIFAVILQVWLLPTPLFQASFWHCGKGVGNCRRLCAVLCRELHGPPSCTSKNLGDLKTIVAMNLWGEVCLAPFPLYCYTCTLHA